MVSKALAVLVFIGLGLLAVTQWRAWAREAGVEAEYPASGEFRTVDNVRIHMKIMGQGPDLVLIHGASGSLRDFTFDLMPLLAKSYRVIAVDRPGMGRSGRPDGYGGIWNRAAESPALQASLLQGAVDQLGVERPLVFGHSYGGAIALAWALERPSDTAGLILSAAASNPWPGKLGLLYRTKDTWLGNAIVIPLLTAFTPHSVVEKTLREVFAPQDPPEGYMAHFGPDMTLRRATLRANAQHVNSLRPHIVEMVKRYPSLDLPVEILHGTEDVVVPPDIHSIPLSKQLPNAQLTLMDGIGHMPHHAEEETVRAAIDRVALRAGLR